VNKLKIKTEKTKLFLEEIIQLKKNFENPEKLSLTDFQEVIDTSYEIVNRIYYLQQKTNKFIEAVRKTPPAVNKKIKQNL